MRFILQTASNLIKTKNVNKILIHFLRICVKDLVSLILRVYTEQIYLFINKESKEIQVPIFKLE